MEELKTFMHDDEIPFFFSFIDNTRTVLEWGSGGSTIAISKVANCIMSIEHDTSWYHKILKHIQDNEISNIIYQFEPPASEYIWRNNGDGSLTQFFRYVMAPLKSNMKFDVILIDGRARPYCAQIAPFLSHKDTKIFIHDYQPDTYEGRSHYILARQSLNFIKQVHDLALFEPKPEFIRDI